PGVFITLCEVEARQWSTVQAIEYGKEGLRLAEASNRDDLKSLAEVTLANAEVRGGDVLQGMERFGRRPRSLAHLLGMQGFWPLYFYWGGRIQEGLSLSR